MTGKDDLTTLITNYLKTLPGDYTARWKEMERLAGLAEGGAFAAPATHAATHATGGSDPILGPLALSSLTATGAITANGSIIGLEYYFHSGSKIFSGGNGMIRLSDAAANDFSLLQFGGTTAAFPALRRNGIALNVVTADGLADADMSARVVTLTQQLSFANGAHIRAGTGTPEGVLALPLGSMWLRTDGGPTTTLYVKTSGAATSTGWTAK